MIFQCCVRVSAFNFQVLTRKSGGARALGNVVHFLGWPSSYDTYRERLIPTNIPGVCRSIIVYSPHQYLHQQNAAGAAASAVSYSCTQLCVQLHLIKLEVLRYYMISGTCYQVPGTFYVYQVTAILSPGHTYKRRLSTILYFSPLCSLERHKYFSQPRDVIHLQVSFETAYDIKSQHSSFHAKSCRAATNVSSVLHQ